MHIHIKGAGVAGLTCAQVLLEHNCTVEIFETSAHLCASACSLYAGGMIAPWCERELGEELILRLGQEALPYWGRFNPNAVRHGTLVVAHARDLTDLSHFAKRTEGFTRLLTEDIRQLEPALGMRFSQ